MDAGEEKKFRELSQTWWDVNGLLKGLHRMNAIRIPHIIECLKSLGVINKELADTDRPLKNISILDIGCGCGILTEALARLGSKVTGVDGVPEVINVANDHALKDESMMNLTYKAGAIQDFAETNQENFDVVVASEVVEHVTEKKEFLEASVKCLKPGGSIFITTINRTFLSRIFSIYVQENILKWIPKGIHEYDMFITPQELTKMLESYNCSTKSVHGMYYFGNKWYWLPITSTWYFVHAVKNN